MNFNDATLIVYLCTWAVLVIWEIVTLVRRWRWPKGQPGMPGTISMVLRDHGHRISCVVFSAVGMPAHWWWNASAWGPSWLGVSYWMITVSLLGWNIWEWKRNPARAWFRDPRLWMILGALAGRFLFPQKGLP
jgi:hypothetical protein